MLPPARFLRSASALRCGRHLHIADESTRLHLDRWAPCRSTIIRVDRVDVLPSSKVVPSQIKAAIERAHGIVVYPTGFPIVVSAIMSAGSRGPIRTIGRLPNSHSLSATTSSEEHCKPSGMVLIKDQYRITIICAVSGAEGTRIEIRPSSATVRRIRTT